MTTNPAIFIITNIRKIYAFQFCKIYVKNEEWFKLLFRNPRINSYKRCKIFKLCTVNILYVEFCIETFVKLRQKKRQLNTLLFHFIQSEFKDEVTAFKKWEDYMTTFKKSREYPAFYWHYSTSEICIDM